MDPLSCWPSALLEGEGKGSILYQKTFPAKLRSPWCSALRFVGSCQLLWHFVASLYMVRVIQEDAFNTFFFLLSALPCFATVLQARLAVQKAPVGALWVRREEIFLRFWAQLPTASCWPSHCCKDPSAPCVDGRENLSRLLKKSVPAAK